MADRDFVAACGLPDASEAERVSLAVRRAVANVGLVDSQFIQTQDDYPGTLELLPLWDSMDWVAFVIELENELSVEISDEDTETLVGGHVTVKEMVFAVYEWFVARQA